MPGQHYRPEALRSERRITTAARIAKVGVLGVAALVGVTASAQAVTHNSGPGRASRPAVAAALIAISGKVGSTTHTATSVAASASASDAPAPIAITTTLAASRSAAAGPPYSRPMLAATRRSTTVHRGSDAPADVPADTDIAATDIPVIAARAYQAAAHWAAANDAACGLRWQYLAAFGRIESDHGRFNGSQLTAAGVTVPPIYGPPIPGILDAHGNPVRAAGPMQFIPSTWAEWGSGNPQNINNAALTAAKYLCADGRNLRTAQGRHDGAFSYNHVEWYATDIEALFQAYRHHTTLTVYPARPPAPKPNKTPSPTPTRRPSKSPSPKPTHPPITPPAPQPTPTRSRHKPTPKPTPKPTKTRAPRPRPTKEPTPSPSPSPSATSSSAAATPSAAPTS